MKVVIDIPENDYWLACNYPDALISIYAHYIKKGVLLPEKHGDLIDRGELWSELGILYEQRNGRVNWNDALMEIKNAPAIVEVEGKE